MVQFYARHDTVYSGDSIVAIPFSYIKKEHIKVYINDNEIKNYTFLNATQIQIDETLTINDIISVRRITPIDDKIVTYQNMSMVLNEDNLNLSQNQSINAIQELYDNNTQFEINTTETIEANKQELIGIIADDKEEMLGIIDTNKTELENAQTEFETEINNTLDVVISAAEKLETLDESVERAENAATAAEQSANTATAEANEAASKAEEATEQAQLATQKAQEAADKVVEFNGKLETKANIDLDNLSETGLKVIEKNSGSGLEICDIGMALYIDESKGLRRWLNGQVVAMNANTQAFLNRLKQIKAAYPSAFTTEQNWQAEKLLSAYGQVGKFVIAEDESTVRIPALVTVQGLLDLQNLGMRVDAGLPNIKGEMYIDAPIGSANGCLYNAKKYMAHTYSATSNVYHSLDFDASLSNQIYKDDCETVQIEAIQYPYFIQIATGQETKAEIINTLELNNPYTLFDCKYSETKLYNASWLRSEGQWNSKATHPKAYEALLVEQNAEVADGTTVELPSGTSYTKRGLSVKLSSESYDDYDLVVNDSDETFRLPLLDGSEILPSDNFTSFGISSLDTTGYTFTASCNGYVFFSGQQANTTTGLFITVNNRLRWFSGLGTINQTFRPTCYLFVKKGDVVHVYGEMGTMIIDDPSTYFGFYKAKGNGSLYFYVGETVQNANLINAGRIEEKLASIIPDNKELITSYGFPSEEYEDLALGASGQEYTMKKDGLLVFQMQTSTGGQVIAIDVLNSNGDVIIEDYGVVAAALQTLSLLLELPAGIKYRLRYNATGQTKVHRVFYAKGGQ